MLKKDLTPEVMDEVIRTIATGESLRKTLIEREIAPGTFFEVLYENPLIDEKYQRAQTARSEMLVEEIVEIADTETDSQKARNRIDARRWYASKMRPNKYGDRIDINVNQTTDVKGALMEARARTTLLPGCDPAKVSDTHIIDITLENDSDATDSKSVVVSDPSEISSDDIFD